MLPATEKIIHGIDTPQPFYGRCNGNRRSQDTIGQHGTAADHSRNDQPFSAIADQTVERKDAAFTVVIGPQRNQHMLYCRQQSDSPDDQRQGTHDKVLIYVGNPTVAFDDGFHNIHGGRANITVYYTECYQEHPQAEFMFVLSLNLLHDFPQNFYYIQ